MNKGSLRFVSKIIIAVISAITPLLILGCAGGGTTGTGGSTILRGQVVNYGQVPIPGVLVTVATKGDSATTDATGNFQIETGELAGDIEVILDTDKVTVRITLPGVPSGTKTITTRLELDEDNDEGRVGDVETEREDDSIDDDDGGSGHGSDDGDSDDDSGDDGLDDGSSDDSGHDSDNGTIDNDGDGSDSDQGDGLDDGQDDHPDGGSDDSIDDPDSEDHPENKHPEDDHPEDNSEPK